MIWVL